MRINRTCKICGDPFSAIKVTQFFCSRKCFKRDYYLRTKIRLQETQENQHYPTKECSFCLESTQLEFDPLESPDLYETWKCLHCGCTNKLVWKYGSSFNSHQIIASVLLTMYEEAPGPIQIEAQYKTYQIPVAHLEDGNKEVLIMTCETMDIVDVQKRNRKKILFS